MQAPAAEMRKRRWLGRDGRGARRLDSCLYRTSDDHLDWLAIRVAMLECDYEVHGPPELVERLRALGERAARATS